MSEEETKVKPEDEEEALLSPAEVEALLGKVDLKLPEAYEDDLLAGQLLAHLTQYHSLLADQKAARHVGNHKAAEELSHAIAQTRLAAAIIQAKNPRAKALADEIASTKVIQTRLQRKAIMETNKDANKDNPRD